MSTAKLKTHLKTRQAMCFIPLQSRDAVPGTKHPQPLTVPAEGEALPHNERGLVQGALGHSRAESRPDAGSGFTAFQ